MSQYFQVGNRELWNPASRVARVFCGVAEVLAAEVGVSTGLGPMVADECQVDVATLEVFVNALLEADQRTSHPIWQAMTEGFVTTAWALLERGGGSVTVVFDDAQLVRWRDLRAQVQHI